MKSEISFVFWFSFKLNLNSSSLRALLRNLLMKYLVSLPVAVLRLANAHEVTHELDRHEELQQRVDESGPLVVVVQLFLQMCTCLCAAD